jgi:hypothetical protein
VPDDGEALEVAEALARRDRLVEHPARSIEVAGIAQRQAQVAEDDRRTRVVADPAPDLERLLIHRPGFGVVAAELEHAAQRVERSRDRRFVTDRPAHLERLSADPLAVLQFAALEGDQPDLVQRRRRVGVQAEPDPQPERLVEPLLRPLEVALDRVEDAGAVQGAGAMGGLLGRSHPERGVEPEAALGDAASDPPVLGQRAGEADHERGVAVGAGTLEDGEEVLVDVVEGREHVRARALHKLKVALLGEPEEVVRVGPVRGDGLATFGEAPRGVVADDPQELVAGPVRPGVCRCGERRRADSEQTRRDEGGDSRLRIDRRRGQAMLDRPIEVRP